MSKWQHISTAPKNGAWILLWWPETEAKVHAGFWSDTGPNDWYRSEADSHPMTAMLDGRPTAWMAIDAPEDEAILALRAYAGAPAGGFSDD